jgi:outer membrane protein assembly factor BamB
MKSKLFIGIFIVALIALLGVMLVGCTTAGPKGWAGPVVNQGVLYLASQEGKIITLDAAKGMSHLPSVEIKSEGGGASFGCSGGSSTETIYSTPVISSDMIYICDYSGYVRAYTQNLAYGWNKKWFKTGGAIIGGAVLSDGYLYFGSSDKKVYALDAATGQLKAGWPFKTKGKIWATPAIVDGVVYIGSLDHHVYALNADTGQPIPGFDFKADGAVITTPIIQGDTIYVGANDNYLYALNKADGSLKWKFKGSRWFWAQPAISGDTIYAVTLSGKLYAIKDKGTYGDPIWQYDIEAKVSAPLLLTKVNDKELLLVGDHHGYLTILNTDETLSPNNHLDRPTIKFKGSIYASMCTSEDQTIVYVYTRNHELHALDLVTNSNKWAGYFDTDDETLVFK